MPYLRHAAPALVLALGACGSPSVVVTGPGTPPTPSGPFVPSPSVSQAEVRAFDQEVNRLAATDRTRPSQLPTGQVSYSGSVGSNATINGQSGYGLLGDLNLNVDFAGAQQVTGSVTDINLLQNGVPQQQLGGALTVTGSQSFGSINADADGIVTRINPSGVTERSNLAIDLDGTVRDDIFAGDAVTGSATGFGDGFQTPGPTFNVVLDGGGSFVGTVGN